MKKRVLAALLALVMTLMLLPVAALAVDSGFEIDGNGVLTKYSGPGGAVTIPGSVTSIGERAFFGCKSLTSVVIPGSVAVIGERAFFGCEGLTSLTISDGAKILDWQAFACCTGLTHVEIPDSVTTIGSCAFLYCSKLTGINVPSRVNEIGAGAFMGCLELAAIQVDPSNQSYTSVDGVVFSRSMDTLAVFPCARQGAYVIPDSVTAIEQLAFHSCWGLTSVAVPSGVTGIADGTFNCCGSLTSVVIPSSVTSIGHLAFDRCTSLKDVYYGGTQEQWEEIDIDTVLNSNGALLSATIHYNSTGPDQPTTQFSDVKAGDWFYDAVNWAVEKEITNGTGESFSPNADCTHDHILTFLWRAAGKPESAAALPFTPKNDWAAGALAWAYEKGMIGADLDEDAACTSADAVVYIWQAKDQPAAAYDGRFTDVAQDAAYAPAVAWAVDAKVTVGDSATTFGPSTVCSRARIVTFLQRAFQ